MFKFDKTLLLLCPRLLVSAFAPTVACGFSPTSAPVQCRLGQQGIVSRGLKTLTTIQDSCRQFLNFPRRINQGLLLLRWEASTSHKDEFQHILTFREFL